MNTEVSTSDRPSGLHTVMSTLPAEPTDGAVTTSSCPACWVTWAEVLPNCTVALAGRLSPVMVTEVPPAVLPDVGVTDLIFQFVDGKLPPLEPVVAVVAAVVPVARVEVAVAVGEDDVEVALVVPGVLVVPAVLVAVGAVEVAVVGDVVGPVVPVPAVLLVPPVLLV